MNLFIANIFSTSFSLSLAIAVGLLSSIRMLQLVRGSSRGGGQFFPQDNLHTSSLTEILIDWMVGCCGMHHSVP